MKYGRIYNFSAGPAMMPEEVLAEIQRCLEAGEAARLDYDPTADY